MELLTAALSWWKCHWPDLKRVGLVPWNLFLDSLKTSTLYCWLSAQWEPSACRSCQCCQKRDHQMFLRGFTLSGLLGPGRATMLPLGALSIGLWVIAVDPPFIAGHQSIKNCAIWIDQLDNLSAVMTTSFILSFSKHPWDKLCANLPHLQFLENNCVHSCHTDIKLCCYCLYRHDGPNPWNSLFGQSTLVFWLPYSSHTSHYPSQTPCLPLISYATQKLMLDLCKML